MLTLLLVALVARMTPPSVSQLPTAPPPREVPVYYYPTKAGAKWVYQEDGIESTHVITGVVKQNNGFEVSVGNVTKAGKPTPLEKYLVSENGLVRLPLRPATVDKSFTILRLPLKVEEKWEYANRGDGAAMGEAGEMKAFPPEEIQVPAGGFTAIRVEAEASILSGTILMKPVRTTYWYSPGVGLVKKIDYRNKTLLLKSFTSEEGR